MLDTVGVAANDQYGNVCVKCLQMKKNGRREQHE